MSELAVRSPRPVLRHVVLEKLVMLDAQVESELRLGVSVELGISPGAYQISVQVCSHLRELEQARTQR